MERLGYSDREAQRMRRRIDERHKRETRRTRIDLLIEGVTAIESVYRDVLAAPAPALNADQSALHTTPRAAAAALAACHASAGGIPHQREGCGAARLAADDAPARGVAGKRRIHSPASPG